MSTNFSIFSKKVNSQSKFHSRKGVKFTLGIHVRENTVTHHSMRFGTVSE